ncbi:MAG: KTSC domain-containing protein [Anaerolineae bacterium]
MTFQYDQDTDTLTIVVGPALDEGYEFEAGDFTVVLDERDAPLEVRIANASRFIAQALAAGVKVEGAPAARPEQSGMVWHDADSSMISAFGYDETEKILEVAFHRTGVYRYCDVPRHVFEGLRDASSQGKYMRNMIIDMYPWEKKRGRSRR